MTSQTAIANEDLRALQAYVTAKDGDQYSRLSSQTLMLDLTHSNLVQQHIEIRFDKHNTILDLKEKIYKKTGTLPSFQTLEVYNAGSLFLTVENNVYDNKKLGYFGIENGMRVHCVDLDPNSGSRNGQYENVDLVEKYIMSDEDYDKRKGTVREWGRKMKEQDPTFTLAKHAKEHGELVEAKRLHASGLPLPDGFKVDDTDAVIRSKSSNAAASSAEENFDESTVSHTKIGERCEVQPGGRRGVVKFTGEINDLGVGGYWVGVEFDEPVGKADGTCKGQHYFDVQGPGFGGFVRGKNVECGDFPERDIFDDDSSEDEL